MPRFKQEKLILLTLGLFTPLVLITSKVNASTFGAEIFALCETEVMIMRVVGKLLMHI